MPCGCDSFPDACDLPASVALNVGSKWDGSIVARIAGRSDDRIIRGLWFKRNRFYADFFNLHSRTFHQPLFWDKVVNPMKLNLI